jgi:hypothetical protein
MYSTMKELDKMERRAKVNSSTIPENENFRYIADLKGCNSSAKKLLSVAYSVVGDLTEASSGRASPPVSEFGYLLTDRQRSGLEKWLLEPTTDEFEENEDVPGTSNRSATTVSQAELTVDNSMFSASGVDTVDTGYSLPLMDTRYRNSAEESDSDMEPEFIEHWQKKGRQKLQDGKYSEAVSYLEKALNRAEFKHGNVHFEGRDGTVELLGIAYCRQGELKDAEECLCKLSDTYEGKLRVLDGLVQAHCERGDWQQAEVLVLTHTRDAPERDVRLRRLAERSVETEAYNVCDFLFKHSSFQARDQTLMYVATKCYEKGRLGEAETLLLEHIKDKPERGVLVSLQMLAELYFVKGQLESAAAFGKRVLKGRRKTVGRENKLFYESVIFLIKVCVAKGEMVDADGYSVLLSSNEEYMAKSQGESLVIVFSL